MLRSDVQAEACDKILREGLEATDEELWMVNPTRNTIVDLVNIFRDDPRPTTNSQSINILARRPTLQNLTEEFHLASVTADLVENGIVDIRVLENTPCHSILLTERAVVSLIDCEQRVAGLTTTSDRFVNATYDEYTQRWQHAEEFAPRTPPLSTIQETLEGEISESAAADFNRLLETYVAGDSDGLNEVALALLVAARNQELLYDISRWGEDIRLASKATFSRTKNELEEKGLIDTEKVPIDVGRPRLRLLLDEGLQARDLEAVARRAESELT